MCIIPAPLLSQSILSRARPSLILSALIKPMAWLGHSRTVDTWFFRPSYVLYIGTKVIVKLGQRVFVIRCVSFVYTYIISGHTEAHSSLYGLTVQSTLFHIWTYVAEVAT
jgi:hypothetical protein